ncbi:MAG: hypothetical protein AB8G22_21560 [Saprospiraceae bacterium]
MARSDSYSKYLTQIEEWVNDGEDYLAIKRKLTVSELPEADQIKLLSRVDDFIVQREHYENQRNQAIAQMILGMTILLTGLLFWIYVTQTGKGQRILFGMALVGGAYILKRGYDKFRQPPRQFSVMQEKKNIFDRYRTKKE